MFFSPFLDPGDGYLKKTVFRLFHKSIRFLYWHYEWLSRSFLNFSHIFQHFEEYE